MCLIIQREPGQGHVEAETAQLAAQSNPDGFGLSWRLEGGELAVQKFGPSERGEFLHLLGQLDGTPDVEYVAHFRKATHGPSIRDLAHPYQYEDPEVGSVLVFHNGIISLQTKASESDTQVFVRDILGSLKPQWWSDPALYWLVEESIGWSRLLIQTHDYSFRMGTGWEQKDGLWYSTKPPVKGALTVVRSKPAVAYAPSEHTSDTPHWSKSDTKTVRLSKRERRRLRKARSHTPEVVAGSEPDFYHHGHPIYCIQRMDDGDDSDPANSFGVALCGECLTRGEYYVIEGDHWIEIEHTGEDAREDEDGAEMIPDSDVEIVEATAAN